MAPDSAAMEGAVNPVPSFSLALCHPCFLITGYLRKTFLKGLYRYRPIPPLNGSARFIAPERPPLTALLPVCFQQHPVWFIQVNLD